MRKDWSLSNSIQYSWNPALTAQARPGSTWAGMRLTTHHSDDDVVVTTMLSYEHVKGLLEPHMSVHRNTDELRKQLVTRVVARYRQPDIDLANLSR